MREGAPGPRTPVMIMVDASWENQDGTVQRLRARLENKSEGGACIRVREKINVGTRILIEGQWERFSGEARYRRKDGREYLVGIQKDRTERPIATGGKGKTERDSAGTLPDVEALLRKVKERRPVEETVEEKVEERSVPKRRSTDWMEALMPPAQEREVWNEEKRARTSAEQTQGLERFKKQDERIPERVGSKEGEERKHMRRKCFEMGHKDEEEADAVTGGKNELANRAPAVAAAEEPGALREGDEEGASEQVDLLSMEDIYRMAGILAPRKGYSIHKIVDMLHSEHLRGSSKEMKRASVLMALDAAGVTVEEVLQDAKARQDAIDSYEAEQRRQFEAQLARKAEENAQIQAELERVKARYTERLRRNLDGVARERATFGNWLTLKQQESQSMAEAVELCLKAPAEEAPRNAIEEVSLAGPRVKPV